MKRIIIIGLLLAIAGCAAYPASRYPVGARVRFIGTSIDGEVVSHIPTGSGEPPLCNVKFKTPLSHATPDGYATVTVPEWKLEPKP